MLTSDVLEKLLKVVHLFVSSSLNSYENSATA
jgi:hypothetical protein